MRRMTEWAQHPQAAAIPSLPLLEIVKIGDSPPERLPKGDRPLSGIRVLHLTRVWPDRPAPAPPSTVPTS